jgi:pimeloyl-ACP methyl ester carboxylesterase
VVRRPLRANTCGLSAAKNLWTNLKGLAMNVRFNRCVLAILAGVFLLRVVVPPVVVAEGSPARINQSSFISIGGIEQWMSIRGEEPGNPVLLVVHGGPGEAQWMAADKYEPWEKAFIVVQWDQRGAGHTYGRYRTQTPDVTLDRIATDGIEVADHLCRTLRKKKIIVLGHSWGSIVAVRMVQLRPDLFAAYVGTGQVASWKASVNMQFDLLLATARRSRSSKPSVGQTLPTPSSTLRSIRASAP